MKTTYSLVSAYVPILTIILSVIANESASNSVHIELPRRDAQDSQCPDLLNPSNRQNIARPDRVSRTFGDVRIVGGRPVDIDLAPYFVLIEAYESNCTGILVSPSTVIVRALCNISTTRYAYIGSTSDPLSSPTKIAVSSFTRHYDFDVDDLHSMDIAYVTLSRNVTTVNNATAKYAFVNVDPNTPQENSAVRIVGYGLSRSDNVADTFRDGFPLYQVDVPVVSWQTCYDTYTDGIPEKKFFCSGYGEGGCAAWYGFPFFSYTFLFVRFRHKLMCKLTEILDNPLFFLLFFISFLSRVFLCV